MSGTSGSVAAASTDAEYEILCDTVGPFLRHYTTTGSGAAATIDTLLDGTTAYVVVGAVTRCGAATNPKLGSTAQRQTGAGTVTIAAGARSVTVIVYAGSPTLAITGGTTVPLPAGTSLSWGVDQGGKTGEALQDSFVFVGLAGADFLVSTTREL